MSSPMKLCDNSSQCDDMYATENESTMCDCQNQLGHYDFNGNLHEDLPRLCRRTLGIKDENTVSPNIDNLTLDDIYEENKENINPDSEWTNVILRRANRNRVRSADENLESTTLTDTNPDSEWTNVILRRANRNRVRSADENLESTTLTDTNKEVTITVDKGDAGDLTSTRGRKRKMADRESPDTWTTKKCKNEISFKINVHVGKKRPRVKISVKVT